MWALTGSSLHIEKYFRNVIKSNQNQIVLPFSDWFGTIRMSVWFQINRKMVNTIWFRFDLIRFRKYFSVCRLTFILQYPSERLIPLVIMGIPWNPSLLCRSGLRRPLKFGPLMPDSRGALYDWSQLTAVAVIRSITSLYNACTLAWVSDSCSGACPWNKLSTCAGREFSLLNIGARSACAKEQEGLIDLQWPARLRTTTLLFCLHRELLWKFLGRTTLATSLRSICRAELLRFAVYIDKRNSRWPDLCKNVSGALARPNV